MEKVEKKSPAKPMIKGGRRKAVDLDDKKLVLESTLAPGEPMPLIVRPAVGEVDLVEWARQNRDTIAERLLVHGALLFRGFGLKTVQDFESVASAICPELFGEYGDLPREGASKRIYHSTPYPADQPILFHSESSHLSRWPLKQFFFCVKASEKGGETPLLDNREVYRSLDPELLRRFEEKGLMYLRNFAEGVDVPWQSFFHTEDRAEVEAMCARDGMECEWTEKGSLRTRLRTRAVATHPKTGEKVFFNQIQLHHISCVEPETRASLRRLFGEEDLPRNVYYGDGSPIDDATVDALGELYWKKCKMTPWEEGDLIVLDNMLTAHARMPFEGARKIVVAMGEMVEAKDI